MGVGGREMILGRLDDGEMKGRILLRNWFEMGRIGSMGSKEKVLGGLDEG